MFFYTGSVSYSDNGTQSLPLKHEKFCMQTTNSQLQFDERITLSSKWQFVHDLRILLLMGGCVTGHSERRHHHESTSHGDLLLFKVAHSSPS